MNLLELYCHVDDFWQGFTPDWQAEQLHSGERQRQQDGQLHESEIMATLIHFHQMRFRNFKTYYTQYVQVYLAAAFPRLVSYSRFIQLMPRVLVPLCAYPQHCFGHCTGISFIDSTPLAVRNNRRISQHAAIPMIANSFREWSIACLASFSVTKAICRKRWRGQLEVVNGLRGS
jgi:hypothetical protein